MSAVEPEPLGEGVLPGIVAEAVTLGFAEFVEGAVGDTLGSRAAGADGPAVRGGRTPSF